MKLIRPLASTLWLVAALGMWIAQPGGRATVNSAIAQESSNPHGEFRVDCRLCHTPDAWLPVRISDEFKHGEFGFALKGAHHETPCLLCHLDLEFKRTTGSQCADCHEDVHMGELGQDCALCHSTRSFIDRSETRRIHRTTRFPLTGAHATVDCGLCHIAVGGSAMRFVNTPTQCEVCHLAAFQGATNPDHASGGFPTDCLQCHSTAGWGGADFNHDLTGFALTGAHKRIECQECHTDFVFSGLPVACVACHQDDYDATSDPNHLASGFSTDCALCHTTSRWEGAVFDHDGLFFPIYSGKHREKWTDCSDCHVAPNNFAQFECIICHEHADPIETSNQHEDVGGYQYLSTACYSCHPNGDE